MSLFDEPGGIALAPPPGPVSLFDEPDSLFSDEPDGHPPADPPGRCQLGSGALWCVTWHECLDDDARQLALDAWWETAKTSSPWPEKHRARELPRVPIQHVEDSDEEVEDDYAPLA